MNINRHNYETLFLLYIDNELSVTERMTVELFVQDNPDLNKELWMLQQSKLTGDPISFENKDSLLKGTGIAEWQEKLLLLADDELPLADRSGIEKLLATDFAVKAEWNLLKQLKLQPDLNIGYPDKQSLYRTSGGRVIGIKWWRIAAAALLLGFGIWGGISFYTNTRSRSVESIVKAENKQYSPKPANVTVKPVGTGNGSNDPVVKETVIAKEQERPSQEPINKKGMQSPENTIEQKSNREKDNIALNGKNVYNLKPSDKLPGTMNNAVKQKSITEKGNIVAVAINKDPGMNLLNNHPGHLEIINNNSSNKNLVANVQLLKPEQNNTIVKNNIGINRFTIPVAENKAVDPENNYAKNAVYNNNEEEKNDTRILYMNEEKTRRTSIGGFFRKLKRVIERNTNNRSGNGIQVAGFEIAVK